MENIPSNVNPTKWKKPLFIIIILLVIAVLFYLYYPFGQFTSPPTCRPGYEQTQGTAPNGGVSTPSKICTKSSKDGGTICHNSKQCTHKCKTSHEIKIQYCKNYTSQSDWEPRMVCEGIYGYCTGSDSFGGALVNDGIVTEEMNF